MDGLLGSCPPLVLCAGFCGWALSSSCPCLGRATGWALRPGLVLVLAAPLNVVRLTGEECGRTNSDVNADKSSLMKQFALGVKIGRTKKSIFDFSWSKRIVLKLFGVYACIICY